MVCADIRGNERYRDCSAAEAPPGQSRAGCLDINHAVTGQPCQICLDDAGVLVSSTCAPGGAGGDIAPTAPGTDPGTDPGMNRDVNTPPPTGTNDNPSVGVDTAVEDPCNANFHVGSQAFINSINQILTEAGLRGDRTRLAQMPAANALRLGRASQTVCGSTESEDYTSGIRTILPFYQGPWKPMDSLRQAALHAHWHGGG